MPQFTVTLLSHPNKGRTVGTRWGGVAFDSNGFTTLECTDADVPLLRALGWLVESTLPEYTPAAVATPDVPVVASGSLQEHAEDPTPSTATLHNRKRR